MARVTGYTPAESASDRFASALKNAAAGSGLFTPAQVAWIVQFDRECRGDDPDEPGFRNLVWRSGFLAGYQARVAEENAEYRAANEAVAADPGRGDLLHLMETVDARRAADRGAGVPRPGDSAGVRDAVRPWAPDRPDLQVDPRPPWERY